MPTPPRPRRPPRSKGNVRQNPEVIVVDIVIPKLVRDAAKARLALVNKAERRKRGTSLTSLSDVARNAVLDWTPKTRRPQANAGVEKTSFRFYMERRPYSQAQARLYAGGRSVASVVKDGLVHFAQNGTMINDSER